jgi:leucyl-tRNA synthetase
MKDYDFKKIEKFWQDEWRKKNIYKVTEDTSKPKYYVLDMFPYPSGAGLHVGHPLGYIASDIFARFKRLKGFNVLHPMGYDAFGLPAEQYAIQTGQHPEKTTRENIARYREQLDKIGFSYDWDREVRTSDPNYYKWTQWIFTKLFHSWYNPETDKAEPIETLIKKFKVKSKKFGESEKHFDELSEKEQSDVLMEYRLAYLAESNVNWCPQLGTVLANDEVKDGVSERGGYPVEKKLMLQWSLRISKYADRLLEGLDRIDWTDSLKEAQRNWIGKSEGSSIQFHLSLNPSPEESETDSIDKKEYDSYITTDPQLWKLLRDKALEMRKNPTPAEDALWQALRRNTTNYHFRRQHIIDRYIADFLCLSKQTIIEVDGDIHDYQIEEDENRTAHLIQLGFKVIRFRNEEVLADPYKIAKQIKEILDAESNSPLHGRGVGGEVIEVFTTRPDTIFGVSFLTLAPEHELVSTLTTPDRKKVVDEYVTLSKNRSERERMADVKKISGEFTGSYAVHPFTGKQIPIWVGDYVLAGYGTGAVMAVPAHDSRDYAFAKHFGLERPVVIQPPVDCDFADQSYDEKNGKAINSDFLNGLETKDAIKKAIEEIEKRNLGKGKTNYRLRDAIFGRQRYWGEPIPIYYENGIPKTVDEKDLPIILPEIDKYLPTENGEPPLARAKDWKYAPHPQPFSFGEGSKNEVLSSGEDLGEVFDFETTTMPGWAGSSWYFLRYMDNKNTNEFVSKDAVDYWKQIDLYLGGSEHATGHLLYFRFWTKFLYDLGLIPFDEPAKKLINQGMIQGVSEKFEMIIVNFKDYLDKHRALKVGPNSYSEYSIDNWEEFSKNGIVKFATPNNLFPDEFIIAKDFVNADVAYYDYKEMCLDVHGFLKSNYGANFIEYVFLTDGGYWKKGEFIEKSKGSKDFITKHEVEKMSKSKYNVVTPDAIVEDYGADTLRLYEMFLGPLEQSKPWNTQGIEGVHRFLKKLWKLFFVEGNFIVTDEEPNKKELKSIHKLIKKVGEDIENFSFNTSVPAFMICANELTDLKCNKKKILTDYLVCLSPYAPHIAEELWAALGKETSIINANFPLFNPEFLIEDSFSYPISINGKHRTNIEMGVDMPQSEVEQLVLNDEIVLKWLEGKQPKKIIFVKGKIVNVVV